MDQVQNLTPICIECKHMTEAGIAGIPTCSSPKREGRFDPIYGMQRAQLFCRTARETETDCGPSGRFFESKKDGFNDPLSLTTPPPKRIIKLRSPFRRLIEWYEHILSRP